MSRTLLASAVALAVLTACTSSADAPSASPDAPDRTPPEATATPRPTAPHRSAVPAPSPTPVGTPSDAPSATPAPGPQFGHGDVVEVTVDDLAVRREPFETARLVSAWQHNDEEERWERVSDEVRLDAGQLVTIDLGPIPIEEIVWYRVQTMAQPGQDPTWHWDWDDSGAQPADPGWIAGSVAGEPYITIYENPPNSAALPGLVLSASGSEDFSSDPFPRHDLFHLRWALSLGEHAAPCEFRVIIEAVDGDEPDPPSVVVVDVALTEPFEQGQVTADGEDLAALGDAEQFRLRVAAACEWALALAAFPHD